MPVANVKSRWTGGNLLFEAPDGTDIALMEGSAAKQLVVPHETKTIRTRFTIAQINAGATLLAAITGYKYRMIDCVAIAIGGAVGAVTTVDILSTQTTAVKLVAFAQASLTQSAVLRAGASGAAVLADGASFVANDSGAAITIGKTGSNVTTATHIDVILTYAVEAA